MVGHRQPRCTSETEYLGGKKTIFILFAGAREVGAGIRLQNTGRIVTFNVKMDANE